jgi:ribosomal protein S1
MSWGRLQNPGELFKVGDTVQVVKVLRFDRARAARFLVTQLLPDPGEHRRALRR